MTRPALTSLLALALALPAPAFAARCDDSIKKLASQPGPSAMYVLPLGDDWSKDLQDQGQACDDAVWRMVGSPGAVEKWKAAGTAQAQAQVLSAAAGVLEKLDADVKALEAEADKVYGAALAANIIKGVGHIEVKIKRGAFQTSDITPNPAPTQFDGSDPDKAAALLRQRAASLSQLAVPGAPAKDAKPGTPPPPARPGPLVIAYFKALDAVRADVAAASALGVSVRPVPALLAGTAGLAPNYSDAMKRLASAQKWDDVQINGSAMDAVQDRALRNRVALNSANVEAIFHEAANIAGTAGAGMKFVDDEKKKKLDAMNAKLRANVADAIGYGDAKRAFDGDVAHNGDYAQTEEGRYRADSLARAKAAADSATIAPNGRGGYQLMVDGKPVQGKDNIPDLKTAQELVDKNQLTDGIAADILKDQPLMAKTKAALEAAKTGAPPSLGSLADPNGVGKSAAGCDKDGESLAEYQKRLRDDQMEKSAGASARRQGPLKEYRDALQKADDDYAANIEGKMNPSVAERLRQKAKKDAHDKYIAATQGAGSLDSDIAARTANLSAIDKAAEDTFIDKIKDAAGDLKTKMRGSLKKYVNDSQARVLLTDGGSDDGNGTLFDQFIAEEWTWGSAGIDRNADACKSSYRQGDYGSLEKCAGKSLNAWLAKRKAGKAVAAPKVDDQVRAGDREGRQ